jgi:hypothetical protein
MKVIISHDVDHLFRSDHYKDLIYPKLWIRSTLEFLRSEYGVKEWYARMISPFAKVHHHIDEVIEFDREHGIPSSFFFGMEKGMGMSYDYNVAKDVIKHVDSQGFDVGVHGISYDDLCKMKIEYERFSEIVGRQDFGIRMHYIRFDEDTFIKLSQCGYVFDTTEFDRKQGYLIKNPYKVGNMWEFPLCIMDGYLPQNIDEKKKKTLEIFDLAHKNNIEYLTILFHDNQFFEGYKSETEWYKWVINMCKKEGYEFISYKNAIIELESKEIK